VKKMPSSREAVSQFSPTKEQLSAVTEDLVQFVHRTVAKENASPAEIAALPEIAKVLYRVFAVN
jgi:hypothetical protein